MATRDFSRKQEQLIANVLFEGRGLTPNSGAGFKKADLQTGRFIVEAKTHTSPVSKHSILLSDLRKLWKLSEGALKVPLYIFDFGRQVLSEEWVLLPERNALIFTPSALGLRQEFLEQKNVNSILIRKPVSNVCFSIEIDGCAYKIVPLSFWKGV